jgi:hypothetical protein
MVHPKEKRLPNEVVYDPFDAVTRGQALENRQPNRAAPLPIEQIGYNVLVHGHHDEPAV